MVSDSDIETGLMTDSMVLKFRDLKQKGVVPSGDVHGQPGTPVWAETSGSAD